MVSLTYIHFHLQMIFYGFTLDAGVTRVWGGCGFMVCGCGAGAGLDL